MFAPLDLVKNVVISCPFGNHLHYPEATSTLGTFTLAARATPLERWWRTLTRIRRYRRPDAWLNWLGLPNPGLEALLCQACSRPEEVHRRIISVHGLNHFEWLKILQKLHWLMNAIGHLPAAIELNVSCPNRSTRERGSDDTDHRAMFALYAEFEQRWRMPVIVKPPPVGYRPLAEAAVVAGLRWFHCCNTLPTGRGGMSGKPLKPLSLDCIEQLRRDYGGMPLVIIGGGGITGPDDVLDYLGAGANKVSVASGLLRLTGRHALVKSLAHAVELATTKVVYPPGGTFPQTTRSASPA